MINKLRKYFFAGLLITLPIFLSVYFIFYIFRFLDGIVGNLINVYFQRKLGFYIPGLGLILFVAILLLAGFLSSHFWGRFFSKFLDRAINKFPLLRNIYPSLKTILEFLFSQKHPSLKKAVLVEYPYKGRWSVGFITNEGLREAREKTGADLVNIYIPLAPNPASGFFVLMDRKDVIIMDMPVKDALQLIISGGVINPSDIIKSE